LLRFAIAAPRLFRHLDAGDDGGQHQHGISYWVMFEKFHSPALAASRYYHWLPFLFFSVYFAPWPTGSTRGGQDRDARSSR
jgi:hypothetical protein